MRWIFPLIVLAQPSAAWEFTPGLPCLLDHSETDVAVRLTYDPRLPLYSISITRAKPWPDGGTFSITYLGQNPFTIATDRQVLSNNGRTLTVQDAGFGNVLMGLEFGTEAVAAVDGAEAKFGLEDAAEATQAFRTCAVPLA